MSKTLLAWVKAARLPSQSYIFFPILLGQAMAVAAGAELDWGVLSLLVAFGLFDQLYIVFANDYADVETDQLNDTYTIFSGGSRVTADGQIAPKHLLWAAVAAAVLAFGSTLALAVVYGRWWAPLLAVFGLGLLWAYSFSPLKLSYRGGGELLQMVGVAGVLPLLGFYGQTGDLLAFDWTSLAWLMPTHLACAVATSLPDEPSDRMSDKRTFTVTIGSRGARATVIWLNLAMVLGLATWGPLSGQPAWHWGSVAGAALVLTAATAVAPRARPGTIRLLAFVFLAVLITVGVTSSAAIGLLVTAG